VSEALDNARNRLLEQLATGGARNLNDPITGRSKPTPSNHPDPRMRQTLADMKPFFSPSPVEPGHVLRYRPAAEAKAALRRDSKDFAALDKSKP
jgi:hypothetical protein